MKKIIYISVFREILLTFFVTTAFLNSVLMMEKILRLSRLLSGVGASFLGIGRIILYLQPQLLLLTIPMSLLLSTLLVYGRMNQDSELTILRTTGMDFLRISVPVIMLGVLCFVAALSVSFYFGPKSSTRLRDQITKMIAVGSTHAIEEGTFNTAFRDIVIMVKKKEAPDLLEDIFIYDNRRKDEPKVLVAKSGRLFVTGDSGIGIDLADGYMNLTRDKTITELFFDRYRFSLALDYSRSQNKMDLTPAELLSKARSAGSEKEKRSLHLEFFRRLSLPAVCFILVFLGPPLALLSGKSGRLGGLATGLLVFTTYYFTLIYFENLVMAGRVPSYVGAWMPSLLLGFFAAVLFRRENGR